MPISAEMLTGTPLLLRTIDARNQEKLQICTCRVDPKGQLLELQEQDGKGHVSKVRINTIAEVLEDTSGDDEPGTIQLVIKGQQDPIDLICASREDFFVWRDGLRSLLAAQKPASPGAKSAATKSSRTVGAGPRSPQAAMAASPEQISHLLERLQLQEELITELRQENGTLNEMVKQKDAVIQELSFDLKSRGTKAEQCNKTESTSRESDEHLRHRETTILKAKNQKLTKEVQKQQKTIKNLMATLQSTLGGQTSDGEMLHEADEVDSDVDPAGRGAAPAGGSDGESSEPEAIREEMAALTGKLARLERDVEELNMPEGFPTGPGGSPGAALAAAMLAARQGGGSPNGGARFQPPPRSAPSPTKAASPAGKQMMSPGAQQRAAMAAAAKAGAAPRGMAGFDFSAVGGAPSMGGGSMSKTSKAALEALARETQVLEEKKRAVEALARQLEPPSDGEDEDDGFPLQ